MANLQLFGSKESKYLLIGIINKCLQMFVSLENFSVFIYQILRNRFQKAIQIY